MPGMIRRNATMTCICNLRSSRAMPTLSNCCASRARSSPLISGGSVRARTPNMPNTISPSRSLDGSITGQSQYPPNSLGCNASPAGRAAPPLAAGDFWPLTSDESSMRRGFPFLRTRASASLKASLQSLSSRISCRVPSGPTIASKIRSVPIAAATNPDRTRNISHNIVRWFSRNWRRSEVVSSRLSSSRNQAISSWSSP